MGLEFGVCGFRFSLPLVSREWKNGSNSSYNCTPFLHSLLTKGKLVTLNPKPWLVTAWSLRTIRLEELSLWGWGLGFRGRLCRVRSFGGVIDL